jgi:transposase-like protein
VHAARLVLWWWLNESFGKSASEIARIYDRDHTSVNESVKKLRNRGIALGTPIQTIERANEVAKIMSMETMETLQRVGRQLAVHGTLSRKKVQPDGDS